MEAIEFIDLARDMCNHYHEGQFRKGSNLPYSTHPIAVSEILRKYGYGDYIIQCMALLHDVVEDSELRLREVQEKFGFEIANGVFILSKNKGRNFDGERLNEKEYKQRLTYSRDKVKRVKIADMIDNSKTLEALSEKGIEKKIKDAREFYIPMGKIVSPMMVKELITNIENYEEKVSP